MYVDQVTRWPPNGTHILAQFDAETVVVYQAYRPSIAEYAIKYGAFAGDFSYARTSWIKLNFLWMYRSGWGTKEGQERNVGLRVRRQFFDRILAQAVASSLDQSDYATRNAWKAAVENSEVRLQWDPDHDPQAHGIGRHKTNTNTPAAGTPATRKPAPTSAMQSPAACPCWLALRRGRRRRGFRLSCRTHCKSRTGCLAP
jgi:hypothetical protein